MIRLLGRKTSGNVQKVIFLLEELGLDYEREDYGRQFGNTKTPEYLSMNPTAKVPTLVDEGITIWESNTILRYLAAKAGSDLLPGDPAARTQVERWMDWQLASLNGPYLAIFKEAKKAPEERAESFAADAKELASQLELLDEALAGKTWVAGDDFSLADICLAPIVVRCVAFPVDLPALTSVKAWLERVGERAAFKTATAG